MREELNFFTKTFPVHPHFQHAYNNLEQQRKQLVELIGNLPPDVYTAAPTGKWSIAQIAMHLLTAETLAIAYMKKKSLGIETLKNSGLKQRILMVVLKVSQRLPFIRYKAPRVLIENTPEALSRQEFINRWDTARGELKQFLEGIPETHNRKLLYKHPVTGMLDTKQGIDFMYEHVKHHLPQIRKLIKKHSFA